MVKTTAFRSHAISLLLLLGCFCSPFGSSASGQELDVKRSGSLESLQTIAEASGYEATSTGQEVEAYLRKVQQGIPGSELRTIGKTVEDRPLWALVVEPTNKVIDAPITVLLLGGIHPGECDGKEALLALMRDLALGKHEQWWRSLRLVFVPNYNADGNERRSPYHRPGQAGPENGMGIRENPQGLDLNRDFMKLDSPEAKSLVAALDEYDVDVLIDTHTTNGSLHQYVLTYEYSTQPFGARSCGSLLARKVPTQDYSRAR